MCKSKSIAKIFFLIVGCCCSTYAQQKLFVSGIEINGNKKTKESILFNELMFHIGDSIELSQLGPIIEESENNLLNTGLFTKVDVDFGEIDMINRTVTPKINVKEGYRFLIVPTISLEAESFNTWWSNYGRSLDRVNWGVYSKFRNLTGRRDELRISFDQGYTERYSIRYTSPYYYNNKLRFYTGVEYSSNKDLDVNQINNQIQNIGSDDEVFINTREAYVGIRYRPQQRIEHTLEFGVTRVELHDSVLYHNPEILGGSRIDRNYDISYGLIIDRRDNKYYPRKGYHIGGTIRKKGLFFNNPAGGMVIQPEYSIYVPLRKGLILEHQTRLSLNINKDPNPYFFTKQFGTDDFFLRGFELYSFRSDDYWISKNSLHIPLFKNEINFGKLIPWKSYREMPIRAFFTLNCDIATIDNKELTTENDLYGTALVGGGVGLNVLFYDQYTLMMEFNRSSKNDSGFFIHFRSDF